MTQIIATEVREAAAGKKYGFITDANGGRYLLPVGMAGVFQQGQTYDVPVKTENWKDQKTGEPKPVYIINGRPAGAAAQAPASRPQTPPSPQPAPVASNSAQTKSAEMFVMGVVGRAMGSGKFETQDLRLLTLAAVEAWNEVKGKL